MLLVQETPRAVVPVGQVRVMGSPVIRLLEQDGNNQETLIEVRKPSHQKRHAQCREKKTPAKYYCYRKRNI